MKSLVRTFAIITLGATFPAIAFDLQGHRGARGLAPENTIEAFSTALSIGVTTLELDIGMTRDGVLVVHHDEWLNPDITRRPDGTFLSRRGPAIYSITLEEVKRYDVGRIKSGTAYAARFPEQRPRDGARIPTLGEVFDLVRRTGAQHIRFNIETKLRPTSGPGAPDAELFARSVAAAVREAGLIERVSIQSFDWRTLVVLRRVGGLWGETNFAHLHVDLFFVPEALRGTGLGRQMLLQAEQEAITRGCRGAWLDTYSFQAHGFYERRGYAVFGIPEDYPPGQKRIFLHKVLVA